jgi:glycerophosphoryl diester phosphodiesterase
MIDEYVHAGVPLREVWPQSFRLDDVRYWIRNAPELARQAVYLDGRYDGDEPFDPAHPERLSPTMQELADMGVRIIAPPMWVLLALDGAKKIVPSEYARAAKRAGLEIITWTLEHSGRLIEDVKEGGGETFYHRTILEAIRSDGDVLVVLDVLARQVAVRGIFSDWPATSTYYANCMRIE